MARSIWNGAISFALVHIPVELHPAADSQALELNMLDRRDFAPIGVRRYNKVTGEEVAWSDIVKGYPYAPDQYVVLTEQDLRRANPEATQTIDIQGFVHAEQVPLMFYDQPYYLVPGKGGERAYALLRETLRSTGRIGIARVVIRVKQHLAALVPMNELIVLNTLRFPAEMRDPAELGVALDGLDQARLSSRERSLALALVDAMSTDWEPDQYRDSYRDDIMALVEKKVRAGQTHALTTEELPPPPDAGKVVDLLTLLQASIGARTSSTPAKPGSPVSSDPAPQRRTS